MTPSLKQRLGLAPVLLDSQARRLLLAARVGSFLFAAEATLVLIAAGIGGGAAGDVRIFVGTGAFSLALIFLLAYERLKALGANLIALAGTASITVLVADPGLGYTYRILYVWPALYVAFFCRDARRPARSAPSSSRLESHSPSRSRLRRPPSFGFSHRESSSARPSSRAACATT